MAKTGKVETRVCRGCRRKMTQWVIGYGDKECLCRKCLNKYLPYAIKKG